MKVVVDVNLSPGWVARLAASGCESHHWSDIGALDAADSVILAWAEAHGAVLLTCDLGFGAILAASGAKSPSVVQIRARDVAPESIGDEVCRVLATLEPELEQGSLVSVDLERARVRILLLRSELPE